MNSDMTDERALGDSQIGFMGLFGEWCETNFVFSPAAQLHSKLLKNK